MLRKYTLSCKSANTLINLAYKENLPLHITAGECYTDSNGGKQSDILLVYDYRNEEVIDELLYRTIPMLELV
ncbi:hypothetical protein [Bacteroides cellulosilyticus]|uniref:hypothetical protein n=1 Tax=Bacteroides cellulosilyticus TaxID=246787 RepID=UPI0035623732